MAFRFPHVNEFIFQTAAFSGKTQDNPTRTALCWSAGQCRGPVTPSLMQYQAKPNFDKYSPEGRHGQAGRIERNAILVPSLMPRW